MSTPTLGIDFGTTKTLVSYIHPETGRPELVNLGRGTNYTPTTVFAEAGGGFLFGDDADDEMMSNATRYCRGFKMKLGSSMPAMAFHDGSRLIRYSAKQLTATFLGHIKKECEERVFMGKSVRKAVITYPIAFSPAQRAELEEAAYQANFTEVLLVSEPEAAGLAFCNLCPESLFKGNALIVDWGGGTLDMALVGRKGAQVRIYGEYTAGNMDMGGEVFDMRLWQHIARLMREQHGTDLTKESPEEQGALLRRVRLEKEMLSKHQARKVRLSTSHGALPPVEITAAEFEQLIRSDVERASELARQLCNSITQATLKPETLILVGGTGLIPCIANTLEKRVGTPCQKWQFSREAVSLGAALYSVKPSVAVENGSTSESPEELYRQAKKLLDSEEKSDWEKAIPLLTKAAEQGYAKAQHELGDCYYDGKGVAQDFLQALQWCRKAAEQGNAEAQCSLGACYYWGYGVAQDYQQAAQWFRKAAEQGHTDAQCSLGLCYYGGNGVTQDYRQAEQWFRKAAEQGHANAQYSLGGCYYVTQDYRQAEQWFRKAAEQGHANAQAMLGKCYYGGNGVAQDYQQAVQRSSDSLEELYRHAKKLLDSEEKSDKEKAIPLLTKAAEQGYAKAQHELGDCYYDGKGVTQDYRQAEQWYRKAAEQGDANAQWMLGNCYHAGNGVTQDYQQAVQWYRKAADQGHTNDQYNLGLCYYWGYGVAQDYQQAEQLFRKAAEQGNSEAQYMLGLCYYEDEGVTQDYRQAEQWFRKAAEQGHANAQAMLGKCYYGGNGVAQDYRQAAQWFRKAAEQGHANAQAMLNYCSPIGRLKLWLEDWGGGMPIPIVIIVITVITVIIVIIVIIVICWLYWLYNIIAAFLILYAP